MKKRILSFLLLLAMLVSNAFAIDLYVDGKQVNTGAEPQIVNERVLVPLRPIFESLNASVTWDNATSKATATKGIIIVEVTNGSSTAYVNGIPATLDAPAQIIKGSTMVPARFAAESLGGKVRWDPATRIVYISTQSQYDNFVAPVKTATTTPTTNTNTSNGSGSGTTTTKPSTNTNTSTPSQSRTVYVTPTGKRYHYRSSCAGKNARATTLSSAKSSGYTACKKCAGG